MDLWIRTQDKTMLIKVDYVQRMNNVIRSNLILGIYNSAEQAEEVLDEIQSLLYTRVMCRADQLNLNSMVYKMPEK